MPYKAIATVLHRRDTIDSVLEAAIVAARRWDAHLQVMCTGVDHTDRGFYYAGAQVLSLQENLLHAQEDAIVLAAEARERLTGEDITWDVQALTVLYDGLDAVLADQMRFHDLVILPSPYGPGAERIDVVIFEACTFGADRPVLILPRKGADLTIRNVQIGWNDGAEAMAASLAALPLMCTARQTDIVLIDPPRHAADRSDPGGRLAQYLARHGVKPEIFVTARGAEGVAARLLRCAHARDIDLIVMGAYGHSRLREAITGGATRDMLYITDLPVLMAR